MNNLLKLSAFLCVLIIVSSCSIDSVEQTLPSESIVNEVFTSQQTCANEDPKSRLVNNGTVTFTFRIVDANSNMVQIQSVAPGSTTTWISFGEGITIFSVESNTSGVTDNKVQLEMDTCTEVDIVVNSGNTIDIPNIQAST